MLDIVPLLPIASAQVSNFSIAFAKLSIRDNEENAVSAGSGVLVSIGGISGILTAAHVLKKLPDDGNVGIVRFTKNRAIQKQTLEMVLTEKLIIGGDGLFGDELPNSPDIGFLRLASNQVAALNATNVFFNLDKRKESVLRGERTSKMYFEGLSGVIAEWTVDHMEGGGGFYRLKGFKGLFGVGDAEQTIDCDGYDLTDFGVSYDESTNAPCDYGGMSGGALWRIYIEEDSDGGLSIVDKRIFGVAFHQSKLIDGKRIITCHGPRSVYGKLFSAVEDRWLTK